MNKSEKKVAFWVLTSIFLPLLIVVGLAVFVEMTVEAVGPVEEAMKDSENPKYDFFAEVPNGDSYDEEESAHIYRVEDTTLDPIVKHLHSLQEPKAVSNRLPDRQLLVFPEELVTVYRDLDDESDVLVEVAPMSFVKEQYHPEIFMVKTNAFEKEPLDMPAFNQFRSYYTGFIEWNDRQYTRYPYYIEENRSSTTSIRNGSAGTRSSRGGGISAGK